MKYFHTKFSSDEGMIPRFFWEAQAVDVIKHSNIARIYDVVVSDASEPYIVMMYLAGVSLDDLMERSDPLDC